MKFDFSVILFGVIIALVILLLLEYFSAEKKIPIDPPSETIITLPEKTIVIHDTIFRPRNIIKEIPKEIENTEMIDSLFGKIDSLNKILISYKVDKYELFDTTLSFFNDTIKDRLQLKYSLVTSHKSLQFDIKPRTIKTTTLTIKIPIQKESFLEQIISDYPYLSTGIAFLGGIFIGVI